MSSNHGSRPFWQALLIGAALILGGCAEGPVLQVQTITQHSYPPSSTVETLNTTPTHPYEVIAHIRGQAPAGTPVAQVLAAIERKAAALGADAVILHDHSQRTAATLQFNPAGGNYQNNSAQIIPIYNATAIRWINSENDNSVSGQ